MKAITVCQPWAWAIVSGPKRVENRSWFSRYRGPLLIHAGKSKAWMCTALADGTPVPEGLAFGALVGVATVVDCVPVATAPPSPFTFGPWCWLLDNVWALAEPVPYRGAQNLWNVPDDVVRSLKFGGGRDLFQEVPAPAPRDLFTSAG